MSEWKQITVNEVCEKVCVGFVGTYSHSQTNSVDGYPMIRTTNLTERGIEFENLTYITKDFHKKNKKSQLKYGDILIARHGDNGKACMFKESFESNCLNVVIVRPDKNKVDPNFFLYQFNSPLVRNEISSYSTGSVQDVINTKDIGRLELYFPLLPEQKSIAEVLCSLDDKIDLLHRNNKTLDQLAETLYKKLFVEEVEDSNKELVLKDIASHIKINVIPNKRPSDLFFHYSLPSFDNDKNPVHELGLNILSNKYLVKSGQTLISKLNPRTPRVWNVFKCEENSICSTEFQVYQAKDPIFSEFVYYFLKSYDTTEILGAAASGTSGSHQRVNPEDISMLCFKEPDMKKVKQFHMTCSSWLEKIHANTCQIRILENFRDTLLPKLMSGTVVIQHN